MELKDFIKTALSEITEAVIETQENVKGKNAYINPSKLDFTKDGTRTLRPGYGSRHVQEIEFNIAVTEIRTDNGKIGIGIFSGVLGGGANYSEGGSNQVASTIKFNIPVALPTSEAPGETEPNIR